MKLGQPTLVGNGNYYIYALSPGGRSSREGHWQEEPIRNFLVVDAETNESSWLFPDTTRIVLEWKEISRTSDCGYESVGLQLDCVQDDSNGDGKLDRRDKLVHLVSAGFKFEPRDLAGEPVDYFWCEENKGRLFCQFRTAKGLESAVFLLDENMTLVSRAVLPEFPVGNNMDEG